MKSSIISTLSQNTGSENATTLSTPLVERVIPPPVYRGTFSSIVAALVAAAADPALIIVETSTRNVFVAKGSAALSAAVDGDTFTGANGVYREVVPSDPNSRSAGISVKILDPSNDSLGDTVTSGVTVPGGQSAFDAALDSALGAQDTAKSLPSLADAIADAMEAQGKGGYIVFDQLAEKCRFYAFPVAAGQLFSVNSIMNAAEAASHLATFNVAVPEVTAPVGFFGV